MSDIKALIEAGKLLNLEGKELQIWVEKERQAELDRRQAELDRVEKERLFELEKAEKERLFELEKVEKERQFEIEREKEREKHEKAASLRELKRLELEVEKEKLSASKTPSMPFPKIKLSVFNEKVDDFENWIFRFQRYAETFYPREQWANLLISLLQGKALSYFRELAPDDANDYERLKTLLLKRFSYTEDTLREKFRTARPEQSEEFGGFVARISNYFDKWAELADVKNEYDKLRDLLIREQIYTSCHKDLVIFLKERKPEDIKSLSTLCEQYRVAHPSKPIAKGTIVQDNPFIASGLENDKSRGRSLTRTPHRFDNRNMSYDRKSFKGSNQRAQVHEQKKYQENRDCFKCGRVGHIAKYCKSNIVCKRCKKIGHHENNCYSQSVAVCKSRHVKLSEHLNHSVDKTKKKTIPCGRSLSPHESQGSLKLYYGLLNGKQVSVIRDSGATVIGVHKRLVAESDHTGKSIPCIQFSGSVEHLPVVRIHIDTPFYTGEIEAVVGSFPGADLVIGNVDGIKSPTQDEICLFYESKEIDMVGAVETRSRKLNTGDRPLGSRTINLDVDPERLKHMQHEDRTLSSCFEQAKTGKQTLYKSASVTFNIENGLLFRTYVSKQEKIQQLVIPRTLVTTVLKLAHDISLAAHLGVKRTKERILNSFYWPAINTDVNLYCKTCTVCQKTRAKGRTPQAPLQKMPVISQPFEKVSIDIVGPIIPATDRGNRYVLTIVDNATRWPEAVALRSITAVSVAEALFNTFSRLGLPKQILSDRGAQFTSELMKELFRLFGIKPINTTSFHPESNGLCERLNGSLKSMLRKVAADKPKDWDRYLPAILFAYREVRQESTGYSPFEMLYGRVPRGPTDVLKDLLTAPSIDESEIPVFEYLTDLRQRLETANEIAASSSERASERAKRYKDKGSKLREFKVGDKVLLLLPTDNSKLLLTWKGPFEVVEKVNDVNYIININGARRKYHINMLQRFNERPEYLCDTEVRRNILTIACTGMVNLEDLKDEDPHDEYNDELKIELPSLKEEQCFQDVNINPEIKGKQKTDLETLVKDFKDVLTDLPGRTDIIEHKIRLTSDTPICLKPYPIPFTSRDIIIKEVKEMLDLDVIEPSVSAYSSPIVLVKKPDKTVRFCIDFRRLNAITITDAEPIPDQESLIAQFDQSRYFSKLDLTKGYWEIPLEKSSREFTAFQTPIGLFQFKVMPFGLVNAPATFARLMRVVFDQIPNTVSFFDDVAIHTKTWDEHIRVLKMVLEQLRKFGLTAKPQKMFLGFEEIVFLGHCVGKGVQRPDHKKIDKLLSLKAAHSKKQVRSLLGILSYYRKFIPNFSSISSVLSDLTRKGQPDKIVWTNDCQTALDALVTALSSNPVLILPDFLSPFILRTDASMSGIGAALLQERNGILHPVTFISRKLLPREMRYSVIERECLAIVWAVQKLSRYLLGVRFVIETDHKPLSFLECRRTTSMRLSRWALALQAYDFSIKHIPGSANCIADILSRD